MLVVEEILVVKCGVCIFAVGFVFLFQLFFITSALAPKDACHKSTECPDTGEPLAEHLAK